MRRSVPWSVVPARPCPTRLILPYREGEPGRPRRVARRNLTAGRPDTYVNTGAAARRTGAGHHALRTRDERQRPSGNRGCPMVEPGRLLNGCRLHLRKTFCIGVIRPSRRSARKVLQPGFEPATPGFHPWALWVNIEQSLRITNAT